MWNMLLKIPTSGHTTISVGIPGSAQAATPQAAKATDEYVHDNPWQAVGIAAVAGVVLGLLISRR